MAARGPDFRGHRRCLGRRLGRRGLAAAARADRDDLQPVALKPLHLQRLGRFCRVNLQRDEAAAGHVVFNINRIYAIDLSAEPVAAERHPQLVPVARLKGVAGFLVFLQVSQPAPAPTTPA